MSEETNRTLKEILREAREAESVDIESAIGLYEEAAKTDPLNEQAYQRLMLLFRKKKDYKKELRIIKQAIKIFEALYRPKNRKSKTITAISNKLNRSFGLADKKGNPVYSPGPIAKWKGRQLIVEKRISKK